MLKLARVLLELKICPYIIRFLQDDRIDVANMSQLKPHMSTSWWRFEARSDVNKFQGKKKIKKITNSDFGDLLESWEQPVHY